jgi:hypothetical protein
MEISRPQPFTDETLPEPLSDNFELPPPESTASSAEKDASGLIVEEGELAAHAVEKEALLPHVFKAAQENEPLEGLRERRHEIKDDSTPTPMVPIGQVVSALDLPKRPSSEPSASSQPYQPPDAAGISQASLKSSPLSYKKAILGGFMGGILIIIAAAGYIIFIR